MEKKIFVLGLGAQKAGTTWLYKYLSSRQDADFGFMKEYHVFDAVAVPERNFHVANLERRISSGKANESDYLRMKFIKDFGAYYDYFADLLKGRDKEITGDITPSYSALPPDLYSEIRSGLISRGFAVKPVFLLRDPVDRLRSAVRMHLYATLKRPPTFDEEVEEMQSVQGSRHDQVVADYRSIVGNIEAVFGDEVLFGLFEEMFSEEFVGNLCTFLGRPYVPADVSEKVNAGPDAEAFPPEHREHFEERYAEIYAFCEQYFGADRINAQWRPR